VTTLKRPKTAKKAPIKVKNAADYSAQLLAWFDTHKRDLPWRRGRSPYSVWLAEIMLQQTTVATVKDYYKRFLAQFPSVEALANAPLEDVLHLWQGLGYYSRARNLHKCAQAVVQDHGGNFPKTAAELQKLPGIGPYTSAAIASIAFNEAATVADGNVERVISRLFAIETPLPDSRPEIRNYAEKLTPNERAGDYAESMMDLGATICTPKSPKCLLCPLHDLCTARDKGLEAELPRKKPKAKRPEKHGAAYCIINEKQQILLRRRPNKGLLAHLWEVPHTGWEHDDLPIDIKGLDQQNHGPIVHVFTHFKLTLEVHTITAPNGLNPEQGEWVNVADLHTKPLPTLMKKVLQQAGVLTA